MQIVKKMEGRVNGAFNLALARLKKNEQMDRFYNRNYTCVVTHDLQASKAKA